MTKIELEKKFDDFLSANNNKYITVLHPPNSRECFDLVVNFTDILGVPHFPNNPSPFPYPNASQIYTDYGEFQKKYFEKIQNTPDYVPQKGDIVVWAGSYNNGPGHVAIATGEGDINIFKAFSQNVPIGSNSHIVSFNYNHVLGALRYKVISSPPTTNMDSNKAVQVDQSLNYLKEVGYIQDNDSNKFLDGKFFELVKKLFSDYELQKKRAKEFDLLFKIAGETGDSNEMVAEVLWHKILAKCPGRKEVIDEVIEKIKSLYES